MTIDATAQERLRAWFAAQLPDADEVAVDGVDAVTFGHSAETILATVRGRSGGRSFAHDVVLRVRPPFPGLLEPYDLGRQFAILRALEPSPVRSPRVLWYENKGTVLGREFYVMEHVAGTAYERAVPPELAGDPARLARMSAGIVDQIAAIHRVDVDAAGLGFLGDGRDHLDRELDHWSGEVRRRQRDPVPALERLHEALRERQPAPSATVTLVHGDTKPGNFAFVGDEVSAVFDWEMTTVGDPLTDLAWTEITWTSPGYFTALPGALTCDELVARYGELTGIPVRHREWYRALQGYKLVVILFVAAMLFDAGHSDDLRFAQMGLGIPAMTAQALGELGITDVPESGAVTARAERVRSVRERTAR